MKETTINTLESIGIETLKYSTTDGSEVLILPHGGRILGLFPKDSNKNFFWTNPEIQNPATAKAFFNCKQWHNTGGDRSWISPEKDFFFPDYPDMNNYSPPDQLDPGSYTVSKINNRIKLCNEFSVTSYKHKKKLDLTITKSLSPAQNPLSYDDTCNTVGIDYAGYTLNTSFEIRTVNNTIPIGLWNILQLPHGGELIVPTFSKAETITYFGNIASEALIIDEQSIHYKMHDKGLHKIGISASTCAGRIGYMYANNDNTRTLIIRNFFVNPSAEYIDIPWNKENPNPKPQYAVQACNVNNDLGRFSEIEYHCPAIGYNSRITSYTDTSQIWAFRGPIENIEMIKRKLLTDQYFSRLVYSKNEFCF